MILKNVILKIIPSYLLILVFTSLSFLGFVMTNVANAKTQQVIVEPVQLWQQGDVTKLYCVVSTPFIYQVSSYAEAELTQLLPVGSLVEEGELIAQQDGFYLERELQTIKLDIRLAKLTLAHAEDQYKRLVTLRKNDLVSQSLHNDLQLKKESSKLQLLKLEQKQKTLTNRSKNLAHYAPFKAQILSASAKQGEQLPVGQNILQLLPIELKQLECKLPLSRYQEIETFDDFSFYLYDTPLALRQISQTVDQDTQNLTLFFDYVPSTSKELLVGQRTQLAMRQYSDDISKVPYDSVKLVGDQYQLWKVNQDNTVSKIFVKILATLDEYFIVKSQVKVGDLVIVRGYQNLQPMQVVNSINKNKTTR